MYWQWWIALFVLFLLSMVMGVWYLWHSAAKNRQTIAIYEYTLYVHQSIAAIEKNVLYQRIASLDFMLAMDHEERMVASTQFDVAEKRTFTAFHLLYQHYRGAKLDVDSALQAFIRWNSHTKQKMGLDEPLKSTTLQHGLQSIGSNCKLSVHLVRQMKDITQFSNQYGDQMFAQLISLYEHSRKQTMFFLCLIVLLVSLWGIATKHLIVPFLSSRK